MGPARRATERGPNVRPLSVLEFLKISKIEDLIGLLTSQPSKRRRTQRSSTTGSETTTTGMVQNNTTTTTTINNSSSQDASSSNHGNRTTKPPRFENDDPDDFYIHQFKEHLEEMSGTFRGISAATRKLLIASKKVIAAKGPAIKSTIRDVGQTRPLAFASEGAVAGERILPRVMYYGAWTLSGIAIASDIYTKQDEAVASGKAWETTLYWTAFHIPASLVIPAYIIHQIVHSVQHAVDNPNGFAKTWSPRVKSVTPVVAALLSIIPVVPIVDTAAEHLMEPTLGAYLGLEFDHHHHPSKHKKEEGKDKHA